MYKKIAWFGATVIVCLVIGTVYLMNAVSRSQSVPAQAPSAVTVSLQAGRPQLVSLSKAADGRANGLQVSGLDAAAQPQPSGSLRCERSYVSGGAGICLMRDFSNPFRAVISGTIFDANLKPVMVFAEEGIPSRARVSSSGALAAYTVFVAGHSYNDTRLSTRTVLIDVTNRREIGDLEKFTVLKDGQEFKAADFNFWGVTFAADGDTFYATLRSSGVNYLVRGAIKLRSMSIVREGVECPSLSPDGTRLAYKSLNPDKQTWRVRVMDLRTRDEVALSETKSVDDQVEWLDGQHLLYEMVENGSYPRTHIMLAAADGTGEPRMFLPDSGSPSVLR